MKSHITYITEQCGARWEVSSTGVGGDRALWVFLVGGKSAAKPCIVGFYARTLDSACDALSN